MAQVTVLARSWTVGVEPYGSCFRGFCSCGWIDEIVYGEQADCVTSVRLHVLLHRNMDERPGFVVEVA